MKSLKFAVPELDQYSRSTHVPVDLHRRSDFALVGSVTSGESVSLRPGAYFAVARLPFGETVVEEFDLGSADEPSEREIVLSELSNALRNHLAVPVHGGDDSWTSELNPGWLAFNPFQDEPIWTQEGSVVGSFPGHVSFTGAGNGRGQFFALSVRPKGASGILPSTHLIAVPASPYCVVEVDVAIASNGRPAAMYRWERHTATILLEYVKMGATSSAARLAGTSEILALELVDDKARDPLAGALGLYVLLSRNALDQIGRRSEYLFTFNKWSADGAIIYAEHLARIGAHQQAQQVLLDLESRGLPVFSMGIRLALSLFDLYLGSEDNGFGGASDRATRLFDVLRVWARRVVFEEPITMVTIDDEWKSRIHQVVSRRYSFSTSATTRPAPKLPV